MHGDLDGARGKARTGEVEVAVCPMTIEDLEQNDARIQLIGALCALRHPRIPRILGAGIRAGYLVLTTEDFEGETLRALGSRCPRLPSSQLFSWLEMVAIAMFDARDNGIYHPTLSTDSIVVTKRGEVKVHGFGVEQLRTGAPTPDDRATWRRSAESLHRIQCELLGRA